MQLARGRTEIGTQLFILFSPNKFLSRYSPRDSKPSVTRPLHPGTDDGGDDASTGRERCRDPHLFALN